MDSSEFTLLEFTSLFVMVAPIAVVPAFLALTAHDTPAQRVRMPRIACFVAGIVLLAFALPGGLIFKFLEITLPAFQIAATVVLLLIGSDMLRARRSTVQETTEETDAGAAKEDSAITPLAVPMLAGPAAISNVILLHGKASGWEQQLLLASCIIAVCAASAFVFALSVQGAKWLSPIILRLTTRLMGLLLAPVAMQFMVSAFRDLGLIPARMP